MRTRPSSDGPDVGSGPRPEPVDNDAAVRLRLLEATEQLVTAIGRSKITMGDIAVRAGLSRGTVYRYFSSRDELLAALLEHSSNRFYHLAGAEMSRRATLADQLEAFVELMVVEIEKIPARIRPHDSPALEIYIEEGHTMLGSTSAFLAPYVDAARQRGEVRTDLDVAEACEWLTRILISFRVFRTSHTHDATDAASVAAFVRRYAITGLC
jgi:AcrR family transcriptional regulator